MTGNPTFTLGLVLSGTVSAGPYTAGVLDFLVEALAAWEKQKQRELDLPPSEWTVPHHNVVIKVIAGASGGAMVGLLSPGVLYGNFEPFTGETEAGGQWKFPLESRNRLFHSWVSSIDIQSLLKTEDLEVPGPVQSLLDSGVIDAISQDFVNVLPLYGHKRPGYVHEALEFYFAVTNLRGVPYRIDLTGGGHQIVHHADPMHFVLTSADADQLRGAYPSLDSAIVLHPLEIGKAQGWDECWDRFRLSALASGAFPMALASRSLAKPKAEYARRRWWVPLEKGGHEPDAPAVCGKLVNIKPDNLWWEAMPEDVAFTAVDGGVINNSPLEYARISLAGYPGGRNPRSADSAHHAVLMVDPLNRPVDDSGPEAPDMFGVGKRMFSAMLNQSRFKPEELTLAQDEDVYSRFLISPIYREGENEPKQYPIYGELMGAFGGFLDIRFRIHDYMLGRRNCQQFLRQHFALPRSNPLFAQAGDAPGLDMTPYLAHEGRPKAYLNHHGETVSELFYQIIPLVKSVRTPIVPPPRISPIDAVDFPQLKRDINNRMERVFNRVMETYFTGIQRLLISVTGGKLIEAIRKQLLERIMAWIKRELAQFDV